MPANEPQLIDLLRATDDRFLTHLCDEYDRRILSALADEWLLDARPWALERLYEYVEVVLALTGHEVVFRKILRHAESTTDHGLMSRLMIELDRCVRRRRVTFRQRTGEGCESREVLRAIPNRCFPPAAPQERVIRHPVTGQQIRWIKRPRRPGPDDRLFTQTTRAWLRRRVWRYFRRLSFRDPDAYRTSMSWVLKRYSDEDLATSDQVIDNRSLMHIGFYGSNALSFGATHVDIRNDASPFDLSPAPWQPQIWASPDGYATLPDIAADAQSGFVRLWAIDLLDSFHADEIGMLDPSHVVRLIAHDDAAVRDFARDVLESREDFKQFSNRQLLSLTLAGDRTASKIGFRELCDRHRQTPLRPDELAALSDGTDCPDTAASIVRWALEELCRQSESPSGKHLPAFFDSSSAPVRTAALEWLTQSDNALACPACVTTPDFWMSLARSPIPRVCSASVTVFRRRFRHLVTFDCHDYLRTIAVTSISGARNQAWAISEFSRRNQEPDHDRAQNSADDLIELVAGGVWSPSRAVRRSALVAIALSAADSDGFRTAVVCRLPDIQFD